MIVVRGMDLDQGWVEVVNLGRCPRPWEREVERFAATARRLGFSDFRQALARHAGASGRQCPPAPVYGTMRTQAPRSKHLCGHQWSLAHGLPQYVGEFELEKDCLSSISRYAALLLASYGPQEEHLMQLRLAVYEIAANVLEHGQREERHGRLWIHLRFEEHVISGWIQDSCERFDPFEATPMPLPEKVLAGLNRGYGIEIIRRHLDGFDHEFNDSGNRINFTKRILR